jgi:adenosylmethionine-8-amino-7-oxononanoate aminotransferase
LAHGFSIRYGRITPPSTVDVALLAPKMFGKPIRQRYLDGSGVMAFVDVIQDASGRALDKTLAIAKAVGFTRYGVLPVSHATETELDLFQEQFLTPLLLDAFRMAFEVLVEAGFERIPSLVDMHASGEMAEMMVEAASAGLYEVIEQQGSPTCRFGVQRYLGKLLGPDVRAKGRAILDDIRDGGFVAALEKEAEAGYPSLSDYTEMYLADEVTTTHDQLRVALDHPAEPAEPDDPVAQDARHVLHPWADLSGLGKQESLIIAEAKGVEVRDSRGKKYLDAIGGMWCVTVGYGNEELIGAIAAQARRMVYFTPFGDVSSEPAAKLAALLAELAPGDLNRVQFTTGGSTAVESAVRIAHYYFASQGRPGKHHVLARVNSYHGSTFLAASLSGKAADRTTFHYESDWVHHLENPVHDPDNSQLSAQAELDRLTAGMAATIADIGPENIACYVAEPVLASGGVLVPPPGYHQAALDLCRRHDILYISDEVVTGFGRLGHFFASEAKFGIVPDMIVTAKGLTSGYQPLGAVLLSDRVADVMAKAANPAKPVFSNGFTYSGHPVACAAAIANIEIMRREDICGHVRAVGPYFIERLRELRSSPIVAAVRGDHLMACVECHAPGEVGPTAANQALARRVDAYCEELGLLVRPYENLCIMSPPLVIAKGEIDRIVDIMAESLARAERDLRAGAIG